MSRLSGKINWTGDNDTPKIKGKEPVEKKEPEFTDAKKLKMVETLLKKAMVLETEVDNAYKLWPTSEMSTIGTLINSIKFYIKKLKPINE